MIMRIVTAKIMRVQQTTIGVPIGHKFIVGSIMIYRWDTRHLSDMIVVGKFENAHTVIRCIILVSLTINRATSECKTINRIYI